MFKKLKKKIEAGDEGAGVEKLSSQPWRPPGSAVRTPPGQDELKTFLPSPSTFSSSALDNIGLVHNAVTRTSVSSFLPILSEQAPTDESVASAGNTEKDNRNVTVNVLPVEVTHTQRELKPAQQEEVLELQDLLSELTRELSTLRVEYEQLGTSKEKQGENYKRVISELKEELVEKTNENKQLEKLIASQKQELEQLSSRLQVYSENSESEMIEMLQHRIMELEKDLQGREREILLSHSRLTSQSRQHKEEQEEDVQKILSMGSTIASLEEAIHAKDIRLAALSGEVHELGVLLAERQGDVAELTAALDNQTRQLKEFQKQMDEELQVHTGQMEQLKSEQRAVVNALQQQLKESREELEDREAQLERMVRELPDLPVTRAVLDGFSRSHLFESLPSGPLPSPGGVYRKNAEPLTPSGTAEGRSFGSDIFPSSEGVHGNNAMHGSQNRNSYEDLESEEGSDGSPAVLPSSVYSTAPVEWEESVGEVEERGQQYSSPYTGQFSTIHSVVQELRKENRRLEELLSSKGKTIRLQQQNISDMKKALSRELRAQSSVDTSPNHPISQPHSNSLSQSQSHSTPPCRSQSQTAPQVPSDIPLISVFQSTSESGKTLRSVIGSDVNFQYLKNVVIRFVCSKEEEAYQLIRAVSTLLELTKTEEKYMKDYLDYKRSWFGSMPTPPFTPFSQ